MSWIGVDFFAVRYLYNGAKIHNRYPVTHIPHNTKVMRDEHHGQSQFFLQSAQKVDDL